MLAIELQLAKKKCKEYILPHEANRLLKSKETSRNQPRQYEKEQEEAKHTYDYSDRGEMNG